MERPQHILDRSIQVLKATLDQDGNGQDANLTTAIYLLKMHPPNVRREEATVDPRVATDWNQLLDAETTTRCQPVAFRRGTLFVHVSCQQWLTEVVRNRRQAILKKLRTRHDNIERISFLLDPHPNDWVFDFFLPPHVFEFSARPQEPFFYDKADPPSPKECVRRALDHVLKTLKERGHLNFSEEAPAIEEPIANQCTPAIYSSAEVKQYNGLKFQSDAEIMICREFEARRVLFFPLAIGDCTGQLRIPDFLVCFESKWGILEVDGETYHTALSKPREDERDRWFKIHGVRVVEHYTAQACFTQPQDVVTQFLALLRANG